MASVLRLGADLDLPQLDGLPNPLRAMPRADASAIGRKSPDGIRLLSVMMGIRVLHQRL